jgi:arylsulfatase A-like enzyme
MVREHCRPARRTISAIIAIICVFLCDGAPKATKAATRPNFVILVTDDQRWDALGVVQREMGAAARFPWFTTATPNIDALASEGIRFRNAFVVSSLCSPSRAAFLTGAYNHRNGVANNHTPFPLTNTTYASKLRAAGYRTGYFGKWHMGDQRERPGFAEYASFIGQGRYFDADFLVNGVKTPSTGWVDDVSTNYAIDFIERGAGAPFALILGFKSSHGPWQPPRRLAGQFSDVTLSPPPNANSYPPYDPTPAPATSRDTDVRNYFRTLVGVDENVGRVLAALNREGIARDTVVVFASDNGLFLDEHGMGLTADGSGNKRAAYQESIRVPLIIRYPRLARRNVTVNARVLNVDLAPTILALAGVPARPSMQGKSLAGLLDGSQTSVRTRFLYEYFFERNYYTPTLVALQRGRYKLVNYPSAAAWTELFDLATDPYETRNIASLPSASSTLQSMTAALNAEKAVVGYVVPSYAD